MSKATFVPVVQEIAGKPAYTWDMIPNQINCIWMLFIGKTIKKKKQADSLD